MATSCDAVEKVLPLYAGGDLAPDEHAAVSRHVASCERCRASTRAHRASQEWLRGSARGPELSGVVLDDLRRTVLSRIAREPRRPAGLRWMERLWSALRSRVPQPLMALAAMLLVVAGGLGVSRVGGLKERPLTDVEPAEVLTVIHDDDVPDLDDVSAGLRAAPEPRSRGKWLLASAESDGNRPRMAPSGGEEQPKPDIRIEIQTKDPNVRIIWLTPTETAAEN